MKLLFRQRFFSWLDSYDVYDEQLFNWTDTYVIDVEHSSDALPALMVTLAIDAEKCSRE